MNHFARLYHQIDRTTKTSEKLEALASYFGSAPPRDSAWALFFLTGRKIKQVVPSRRMRDWARAESGVPSWLFEECYDAVGDIAETITLLLPTREGSSVEPLWKWVEERISPLRNLDQAEQKRALLACWAELDERQLLVANKLMTGGFRVGVSQQLVVRGLAKATGLDAKVLAHRLMGEWEPSEPFYRRLIDPDAHDASLSRPYPFCLAHGLEANPATLGSTDSWLIEWKWDGIRSQLIKRDGSIFLWTRGEELVSDRYPELTQLQVDLPEGTVLDGEILAWKEGRPLPFSQLQRRIGRKNVGSRLLRDVPVILLAYDLLELEGVDLRTRPLRERRSALEAIVSGMRTGRPLLISPELRVDSWDQVSEQRDASRHAGAEGLMLKRWDSTYEVGRVRGAWWKWKVDPLTVDAVLVAAQRGSGKRASLYTDYTFAVWDDNDTLVPVAKAYSGLTDAEIREVDGWIRNHMVEKYGPVRTVAPVRVFELAFENIQRSPRHKSGLAVRFPRILRIRDDKLAQQADRLATLIEMAEAIERRHQTTDLSASRRPVLEQQGLLFE